MPTIIYRSRLIHVNSLRVSKPYCDALSIDLLKSGIPERPYFVLPKLGPNRRRLESPQNLVIDLSVGEFELLIAFAEHPQRVLNRDQLLDLTRGRAAVPFDQSIDNQALRLRRNTETDPKHSELIKTIRGGVYLFVGPVERA